MLNTYLLYCDISRIYLYNYKIHLNVKVNVTLFIISVIINIYWILIIL